MWRFSLVRMSIDSSNRCIRVDRCWSSSSPCCVTSPPPPLPCRPSSYPMCYPHFDFLFLWLSPAVQGLGWACTPFGKRLHGFMGLAALGTMLTRSKGPSSFSRSRTLPTIPVRCVLCGFVEAYYCTACSFFLFRNFV